MENDDIVKFVLDCWNEMKPKTPATILMGHDFFKVYEDSFVTTQRFGFDEPTEPVEKYLKFKSADCYQLASKSNILIIISANGEKRVFRLEEHGPRT